MAPPAQEVGDLATRPVGAHDLDACLGLLRGHLAYPDDLLAVLPGVWRRLLREDALKATIVEASRPDGAPVVAGFGASVFVSDESMASADRGTEPYLTARTIRAELGDRSPILRPAAAAANDGLNILVLHYGEDRRLPAELLRALRYRMFESFVETHRGYPVKAILQEFWDELPPES